MTWHRLKTACLVRGAIWVKSDDTMLRQGGSFGSRMWVAHSHPNPLLT